jgi:hypothetical protein
VNAYTYSVGVLASSVGVCVCVCVCVCVFVCVRQTLFLSLPHKHVIQSLPLSLSLSPSLPPSPPHTGVLSYGLTVIPLLFQSATRSLALTGLSRSLTLSRALSVCLPPFLSISFLFRIVYIMVVGRWLSWVKMLMYCMPQRCVCVCVFVVCVCARRRSMPCPSPGNRETQ